MRRTCFFHALWAGLLLACALPAIHAQNITTLVNGQPVTIGSISASVGYAGSSGYMDGTFSFSSGYGGLDDNYDFRWVQIITSSGGYTFQNYNGTMQFNSGNGTNSPWVDAPKGGYDYQTSTGTTSGKQGDDNAPFYEHEDTATAPGGGAFAFPGFAFAQLHTEGVSSSLYDYPQIPSGVFTADTFLVATPPENADGTFTASTFDVLGGYTWSVNFSVSPPAAAGAFFSDDAVTLANDAVIINTGIRNGGYRSAWSATFGQNLVLAPEPSAWISLAVGALCLGTLAVRARRRAS